MKKRILLTAVILTILFVSACNILSEDPKEENEEEVGTGEQEEESPSEDEENEVVEEDEPEETGADESEEEDNNDENSDGDEESEEPADPEEAESAKKLAILYGTWEMEDEENSSDVMVLEISDAKAEVAGDQEDDFEYIRFGYKYSEFFPMEKIINIEKQEAENTYYITTVYVEDVEENGSGMNTDPSDEETHYTIKLRDNNTLLLSHRNGEEVVEMQFNR